MIPANVKDRAAYQSIFDQMNSVIHLWVEQMEAASYRSAAQIAITEIRRLHEQSLTATAEQMQALYGVRAFTNGLRDLANLKLIIGNEKWFVFPLAVEAAWDLAHDADDRLFGFREIDEEFVEYCKEPIRAVQSKVNECYGPGRYSSWELVVESESCTICNSDWRACDHVPGEWYNGIECILRPEDGYIRAVALVENPCDYRCRLWPWQFDSENSKVARMRVYSIFSEIGEDDGGALIDVEGLFPAVPQTLLETNTDNRYKVLAYRELSREEILAVVNHHIESRGRPERGETVHLLSIIGSQDGK